MHKILRAESGLPPFLAEPAHMRSKTRILLRTLTVTALMLGAARPLSSQEFTPPVPLLEMTGHRGVVRFLQYLPPDGRNILSAVRPLLDRLGLEVRRGGHPAC